MKRFNALLSIYRGTTAGLVFLAPALLKWRQRHGKEDSSRLAERLGYKKQVISELNNLMRLTNIFLT